MGDTAGEPTQIRLAVAMNGGVSLAVWIGGVAYELWRYAQSRGAWRPASTSEDEDAAPKDVRIDVLSGTSAGGINAAFLALASLYPDVEVGGRPAMEALRDLWLDDAGLEPAEGVPADTPPLIRDPSTKSLGSLLDGDLFLRRLGHAIGLLLPDGGTAPPALPELDLQLTATSLNGAADDVLGDDGQVFANRRYASYFHFRHGLGGRTDFAVDGGKREGLRACLARAARSTASFPFAFEPSKLGDDEGHAGVIEGARDRVFVDGGVLNNLPVDRAVEAVFQMPADMPVHRHLVAVVPDPPGPAAATPPGLAAREDATFDLSAIVVASALGIPRTQSIADVLRDLRANNGAVEALRGARARLLQRSVDELAGAADALWDSYGANRRVQTAWQLAESWAKARPDVPHTFEHFKDAADAVTFPWLHDSWRRTGPGNPCWGASMLRRRVATLLDLIRQARRAGVPGLGHLQKRVHDIRSRADELNPLGLGTEQLVESMRSGRFSAAALQEALGHWPHAGGTVEPADPGQRQVELGALLTGLGSVLVGVGEAWSAAHETGAAAPPRLLREVTPANAHDVLCALEVTLYAFRDFAYSAEQLVHVALLSPRLRCPLDRHGRTSAEEKLAGDELGHFGAFLKRSWRANDWMWGRLDAASFIGSLRPDADGARAADAHVEIVQQEAPILCRAVQADHRRGARNRYGSRLTTPVEGRPAEFATWDEVKANLGLPAGERDAACAFLGLVEIGAETVRSEHATTLVARVGAKAAATAARVLETAGLPAQGLVRRGLAPIAGVARSAYRYTASIRPGAAAGGVPRGWFVAAVAAIVVPAVVAFAGVLGADLWLAGPLAWTALIGALLGAALIAPVTTAVLAGIVGGAGLLASLPDEPWPWLGAWARDGDAWAWSWLPLSPWIALPVMAAALAVVPSRPVDWFDERWSAMRGRAQETVDAWRDGVPPRVAPAPVRAARSRVARWWATHGGTVVMVVLLAGAPAAKWLQLEHDPPGDWWRQLGLVGVVLVAVVVAYRGRWWRAAAAWQVAWPQPGSGPATGEARGWRAWGDDGRPLRLGLGVVAVVLCATSGALVVGEVAGRGVVAALLVAAAGAVVALLVVELGRERAWPGRRLAALARACPEGGPPASGPPPDRAVLWAVAPAVLVWSAVLLAGLAWNGHLDPDMTAGADGLRATSGFEGGAGRLLATALVIGLGEELLYRGLLLALAVRTGFDRLGFLALSLSFAAWHLPDAWGNAGEVIVVLAATFAASHLILFPLRLRSRTLAGPVLLHTAVNASLLLL